MIENWIVLLNFNLGARCSAHVSDLAANPDIGMFVVDNASAAADYSTLKRTVLDAGGRVFESDDPVRNAVDARSFIQANGRLILFRNHNNLGYSGGNNTALRLLASLLEGRGQFLVVNPDVIITPSVAATLLAHPADICGPAVYEHYMKAVSKYGHDIEFSTGFSAPAAQVTKIACISGCCFKLSSNALERFGYLPDENFLYDEEVRYFERVHRLGGVPAYLPEIQIEHVGSASVKKRSFIYFYYIFRNRLTYFRQVAGPRYGRYARFTMLYGAWCIDAIYGNLKRRNWDGIRGILRGVWDGFKGLDGPLVK